MEFHFRWLRLSLVLLAFVVGMFYNPGILFFLVRYTLLQLRLVSANVKLQRSDWRVSGQMDYSFFMSKEYTNTCV